ncbi:ATP-dependent RNA helicase DeaD [bioreactor metagenome]|uniref:ATP-dependent RNA helicase DeaD n=1 Tax=bioreactor metagenome TaxID=1076179 RepID=A0A645CUB8_9ZZZZ
MGAIAERTGIAGKDIGKIQIYDKETIVGIPKDKVMQVLDEMKGCKICGLVTHTVLCVDDKHNKTRDENKPKAPFRNSNKIKNMKNDGNKRSDRSKKQYLKQRHDSRKTNKGK